MLKGTMVIKQDCDITKTQFPWTELVLTTFHLNHSVIISSKTSETLETWKVCLTTGYTDYYKIVSFLLPCKILIAIERKDFFYYYYYSYIPSRQKWFRFPHEAMYNLTYLFFFSFKNLFKLSLFSAIFLPAAFKVFFLEYLCDNTKMSK